MSEQNKPVTKVSAAVDLINKSAPGQIAMIPFVQEKFIQNYNATHKDKQGEMQYHRQMIFFNQQINGSSQLAKCEPFSLYACFVTAAVNGYSFDPADDEVYLIPRGGKAALQRQAGAHVKRLQRIEAVRSCDQAQLVYEGDEFIVSKGRVLDHIEHFKSKRIIAGYVIFKIDEKGTEKHFIYRESDWETWKKKSQMPTGDNWAGNNGQPQPGFLRTKIILHACKDKSWPTGFTPPSVDSYDVEVDEDDENKKVAIPPMQTSTVQQTPTNTFIQDADVVQPSTDNAKAAVLQMTEAEETSEGSISIDNQNDF